MGNFVENDFLKARLIGKTIRDIDNNSTDLVIPKKLAKELNIESSKVSMSLLGNYGSNNHLVVTKYHDEIVID
jgi:hypothetical protein